MNRVELLIKLRDKIYNWAKVELVGQIVINIDSKIEVLISNRGIKHTLKGKSYKNLELIEKNEAMIMSIKHLKFFLETSKYIVFEKDKRERDNILGFHVFANTFSYNNINYKVKILVRETTEKLYFYDQSLIGKN